MKRLIALAVFAAAVAANAAPYYFDGILDTTSPTTHVPGTSTTAPGIQYYNVFAFQVTTTGSYVIESASPNVGAGSPSISLDTFLGLYTGSFNPAAPGAATQTNDDFTGALTVLPGPYSGAGVTATATGFTGAQPSSRMTSALTAGTLYFLINTSFRSVGYVNTTEGDDDGAFYTGISGPGDVTPVPEPATVLAIGAGLALLAARRRR